jgi:hypothetical protein
MIREGITKIVHLRTLLNFFSLQGSVSPLINHFSQCCDFRLYKKKVITEKNNGILNLIIAWYEVSTFQQ